MTKTHQNLILTPGYESANSIINLQPAFQPLCFRAQLQEFCQDPQASLNPRMTVGDIIGEAIDVHKLLTGEARTGGVMADPVLNNIFTYPNPRDPQFYIPWHEDMNTDWLNAGWLISDGKIRNDSNSDRDEYYEFDGE